VLSKRAWKARGNLATSPGGFGILEGKDVHRMSRLRGLLGRALWALLLAQWPVAHAATPLHEQIDRWIERGVEQRHSGSSVAPAAPATDGEFVRRVWLDLAGMIPTADEARAFLDDPSPYKRAQLIDRLLSAPGYARRMQRVFDVFWMERRPDQYVEEKAWREFLMRAFDENRPYDELARAILSAGGTESSGRGAAKFLLEREADPHTIVRDVGRMFLGVDLTCCQCHDHPLIDGYKQADYYGLFAFVSRTILVKDRPGGAVLGEKAEGDVTFSSVFKKKVTHRTGPRVPGGKPLFESGAPPGQEYLVPPDKDGKVAPVPAMSRRAHLALSIASADVPAFSRNVVNRLWALFLGRGIVEPVDLHHGENPPSHPELIDLLAREFTASHYNLKQFVRELTLTRAYQRSSQPPPDSAPGLEDPALFAVAALRPLSPEQLAWSVMQALGLVAGTQDEVVQKLEGADPRMRAILGQDSSRRSLRGRLIEQAVFERLEPHVRPFVRQFGGVAAQPQQAAESSSTVDQALFLTNGEPLKGWLSPHPGRLVGRCASMADSAAVAEEVYLSVLSRRPTGEERGEVARYLAARPKDRTSAIREVAWALLTSTEFRFNH
jgi:hypothetical protein